MITSYVQVDLVAAITQGGLGSSGDERVADGDMSGRGPRRLHAELLVRAPTAPPCA